MSVERIVLILPHRIIYVRLSWMRNHNICVPVMRIWELEILYPPPVPRFPASPARASPSFLLQGGLPGYPCIVGGIGL
jgi:hypothetical protein